MEPGAISRGWSNMLEQGNPKSRSYRATPRTWHVDWAIKRQKEARHGGVYLA